MNLLIRYYSLSRLQLFIYIILANLVLVWISKSVLVNDIVFYNTYSEQLTYERSVQLFDNMNSLSWISYVFTPIILLMKFSLISVVIYIGIVLCDIKEKVSMSSVFKVVVGSEIIFIIAGFIKFFWFYLFAGNYNLNDLGFFYPLSLINLFKVSEVTRFWIFPLQTINFFHLIYIISLSYGLNIVCKVEKTDSEKVVLLSYLPSLVLWVAFIMLLTVDNVSL